MTIQVQEEADITSVELQADHIRVRGYQNFDVYRNKIDFSMEDSHSWTDTNLKTEIITAFLAKQGCESYIDFGSNLGVLVFGAAQNNVQSVGVDYNHDYIKVCDVIANYLNFTNAKFVTAGFDFFEGTEGADLISMMNIHHHLFGRTDRPLSLIEINQAALKKCKWLITQFPTELDSKAAKWTSMYPGVGDYSLGAFIESLAGQEYRVLYDSETRPIVLVRGYK